jgi:hypothetical protein
MVNWTEVLANRKQLRTVAKFAGGDMSASQLRSSFKGTDASREVNSLIKTHGTTYARRLARKALKRRGTVVTAPQD